MIQWITLCEEENKNTREYINTTLHEPRSLDEFEINIIDLSDERIWTNDGYETYTCRKDWRIV